MILITCCKHYDKAVNFLYLENDIISKLLIEYYQEYVFNIKSEKSKIRVDKIMCIYTEKEDFYDYVQERLQEDIYDNYDKVIRKLIKIYKQFEIDKLKKVKNTRWL